MNDPYETPEKSQNTQAGNRRSLFLLGTYCLGASIFWVLVSSILTTLLLHDLSKGKSLEGIIGGYLTILMIFSGFLFGLPLGLTGIFLQMLSLKKHHQS